jgi:hypothetical protein
VYASSRRTLQAGGYSLWSFCNAIATEYRRTEWIQRADGLIALRGGQSAAPVAATPAGAWQWPQQGLRTAP